MRAPVSLVALALAVIGAYARPTVHAVDGSLEIPLSAPLASVSDLRVVVTIKNIGGKDLKIPKSGIVLDSKVPTPSSSLNEDRRGDHLTGVMVSVPMDHLSENEWITIPAGKDVTTERKVSAVYGLSASDPETFTFDPVSRLQTIEPPNDTITITSDTTHTNITNDRFVSTATDISKRELELKKRFIINCQDSDRKSAITASLQEARTLASIAASYIAARGGSDPLYQAYFGSHPISSAILAYNTIEVKDLPAGWMSCADIQGTCSVKVAYTYQSNIYFCDRFFVQQTSLSSLCNGNAVNDRNLRGGSTLYQLAIALGVAHDIIVGCPDDQRLPNDQKIINADNYRCFATQVYANTKC